MRIKDLTDQKFGRLTAIESTEKRKYNCVVWRCICDCGKECFVDSNSLGNNNTRSCGCLQPDQISKRNTTHGMAKTKIYKIWRGMIDRCENPSRPNYRYYGGRGIKVCERWHTFENFYEDVGDPPEGKSLDRWPDNDGDYEPANFRWATPHEQNLNSRPMSCGPNKQRWFFAFNLNTGEWDENNNQREFAKKRNLNSSHISRCLSGKQTIHKGWIFSFLSK